MKEKILGLRNLNYDLELFNGKKRFAVYKNDEYNNIIIYSYDKGCSVDSVSGAIRDSAYNHLIDVLNRENNILVYWSQVEGTTSDYSLYYDIDYDKASSSIKDKTINEYLKSLILTNLAPHYKYTQIKNGVNANIIPILEA